MLRFYYNAGPNPLKVGLFLEECGLPYEGVPIDTRRGQQHDPAFLAINPNAKVPAIVDGDTVVFDSNAILLYLAEKTGQYLPENTAAARGALLSWLFFVASGVGPYSGQAYHFRHVAPEGNHYSRKRYDYEARRHWRIVDDRLSQGPYMLSDRYTIVDMAVWGWAKLINNMLGDDAIAQFPNIARLIAEIDARPAGQRALGLKDRHAFKLELDEAAMRMMYPQMFAPDPA